MPKALKEVLSAQGKLKQAS